MTIRYAGIALMVGVVLAFVAPLFMPGYTFINPVDQTDFPAALDALGDSAVLAQWMTFFTLISLLLMSFGFLCLYPLASRQAGLGGRLLQFGIIATLIEWSILIIATGMRHFEIHLMQRGRNLATDGSQSAADFEVAALAVHIDMQRRSRWHLSRWPRWRPACSALGYPGGLPRWTSSKLRATSWLQVDWWGWSTSCSR